MSIRTGEGSLGGVKRFTRIGAVVTLGLSLTACGGSSAKPKPTTAPLSADALKAALLPASDFEAGVKWDIPDTSDIPADSGCLWLIYGGARGTEVASADTLGDVFTDMKVFYERAGQYRPGGAASVLAAMVDQAHGKCANFTETFSGPVTYNTTTVTPVSGLGDKADLFEVTMDTTGDGPVMPYEALDVEYGDVLVSVTCLGPADFLRSCDLDAKVKKIAGQLKLV